MFNNAQNFKIDNSPLTNITNSHVSTTLTGIDILLEASTPEAAYDSSARDPPPRCFPGTRREFVEDILLWAVPPVGSSPAPIYRMKGPAGVGKSAVAQTCVERLKRLDKRCPAFFFSTNGRNKHQRFFPTIAYQLATLYPDYHDLIDSKIRRNRTLVDKTLETQYRGLIAEPLQELEKKGKGIGTRIPVLVDGLDECESQEAQCEIIEIVAAAAHEGAAPLCWAFFSRPEPHIEATFSQASISPSCHTTVLPISRGADGDIELYLKVGFANILRHRNVSVNSPWPSRNVMKEFVRAAGGLFLYAKTLLQFFGQSGLLNPEELLRAITAGVPGSGQRATIVEPTFVELDALYTLIMQRIPAEILLSTRLLLATVCWSYSPSAVVIANTLGLSQVELETICHRMASVIRFQHQESPLALDPTVDTSRSFLRTNPNHLTGACNLIRHSLGGSVSFYHKSFRDFLLDPLRSGGYCINTPAMNENMNKHKWDLVLRFEKNHHWQGSELVRTSGAPNSTSNLSYPYTNELLDSLVEAWIYRCVDVITTPLEANFDFRKHFYVTAKLSSSMSSSKPVSRPRLHKCAGFRKYIQRTALAWLQPGEFTKFSITAFKEDIKSQQEMDFLRPIYANTPAFLEVPISRIESGLYVVGRKSKSIFWYWEINYDTKSFKQFHTLDLEEGQRIHAEGRYRL